MRISWYHKQSKNSIPRAICFVTALMSSPTSCQAVAPLSLRIPSENHAPSVALKRSASDRTSSDRRVSRSGLTVSTKVGWSVGSDLKMVRSDTGCFDVEQRSTTTTSLSPCCSVASGGAGSTKIEHSCRGTDEWSNLPASWDCRNHITTVIGGLLGSRRRSVTLRSASFVRQCLMARRIAGASE